MTIWTTGSMSPTRRSGSSTPCRWHRTSLFRGTVAQADATDVPCKFASNYFDVSTGAAEWSVRTATGGVTVGTVPIDPGRGDKYTIVALPASGTTNNLYVINQDVLLLTVPDPASASAIKTLVKIEGTAGAGEVPAL